MSVAIVDGSSVAAFVNDSNAFEPWVTQRFDLLDVNGDGFLSRDELRNRLGDLPAVEYELQSEDEIKVLYDELFKQFDANQKGTIDQQEFSTLMKEITLAKARGIGESPISVILQEDSLLMRVVEHESTKAK